MNVCVQHKCLDVKSIQGPYSILDSRSYLILIVRFHQYALLRSHNYHHRGSGLRLTQSPARACWYAPRHRRSGRCEPCSSTRSMRSVRMYRHIQHVCDKLCFAHERRLVSLHAPPMSELAELVTLHIASVPSLVLHVKDATSA